MEQENPRGDASWRPCQPPCHRRVSLDTNVLPAVVSMRQYRSGLARNSLEVTVDTSQLLKGVLDMAVLATVSVDDGYGYDVVRRLREAGLADIADASVYGTLRRLYTAGALTSYVVPSEAGPHRKYYGITDHGKSLLKTQRDDWGHFAITISNLLANEGART